MSLPVVGGRQGGTSRRIRRAAWGLAQSRRMGQNQHRAFATGF